MPATPRSESLKLSPREWVEKVMKDTGVEGDPKSHLVVWDRNRIADCYQVWTAKTPDITRPITPDIRVHTLENDEVAPISVIRDDGEKLWVRRIGKGVEFSIASSDVLFTPIPMKPKAIHFSGLPFYIGNQAANDILRTWPVGSTQN